MSPFHLHEREPVAHSLFGIFQRFVSVSRHRQQSSLSAGLPARTGTWLKMVGASIGISGAIFFSVPWDRQPPEFGSAYVKMELDEITPSWDAALRRHDEQEQTHFTGFRRDAIAFWKKGLDLARKPPSLGMLSALNAHFNRVRYVSENRLNRYADTWMTPLEFITAGGDCEDYVIAKFIALRAAGWPWRNRRLIVGQLPDGSHHAVLVVRLHDFDHTWYMLDNRSDRVRKVETVADFIPFFGMSARSTWVYKRNWSVLATQTVPLETREPSAVCASRPEADHATVLGESGRPRKAEAKDC